MGWLIRDLRQELGRLATDLSGKRLPRDVWTYVQFLPCHNIFVFEAISNPPYAYTADCANFMSEPIAVMIGYENVVYGPILPSIGSGEEVPMVPYEGAETSTTSS